MLQPAEWHRPEFFFRKPSPAAAAGKPTAPFMIAKSDSLEASLFFRVAAIPPVTGADWVRWGNRARPLDWDRIINVALAENAITVLHNRVAMVPNGMIPSEVRGRIERLALVWTFKLRLLERRLRESVEVLSRHGIEVTLLKGAALAITKYHGFAERPMADIDLLVSPDKAQRAHELMRNAGWAHDNPQHPDGAWVDHHHLPPLSDKSGSGLRLEIHVAPLASGNPFRLDYRDLLEGSTEVDVGGARVRVPEPHMHAVHAAIHFAWSHRFTGGRLNVFRDLAALHASGSVTWDNLVAAARRTRSETSCYWTLRLARALTQLPVPDAVLAQLSPPLSDRALSVLEQHISQLILRSDHACPSVVLRDRLWALALQVPRPDRVEPAHWETSAAAPPRRTAGGAIRRFGGHVLRVPRWSRYVASLLPPALELQG